MAAPAKAVAQAQAMVKAVAPRTMKITQVSHALASVVVVAVVVVVVF